MDAQREAGRAGGGSSLLALAGELAAVGRRASALPWRSLAADTLDAADVHPVPVVLVHGLFGDPTNFAALRQHLARHGIRRFSSFAFAPRLDYQRLSLGLRAHVERVCRTIGVDRVDVVAHSLGGLVARYGVQTWDVPRVRRLVTLGTPYLAERHPEQELAIFAADDLIVPPPRDGARRRVQVIAGCGHVGLLTDARALDLVTRHLRRPVLVRRAPASLAA